MSYTIKQNKVILPQQSCLLYILILSITYFCPRSTAHQYGSVSILVWVHETSLVENKIPLVFPSFALWGPYIDGLSWYVELWYDSLPTAILLRAEKIISTHFFNVSTYKIYNWSLTIAAYSHSNCISIESL
jgi:hypothetical protein